jgi:adenylate cyclase
MIDIIGRYRGTVNGFMGDGILAFFGAPLQTGNEPSRAVACAIEMQGALVNFNQEQRRLNLPELAMGIGINTGDAVVGNIGSEKRASYGAVGTPINVAFRIESYTIGGQVLISPDTYAKVKKDVKIQSTKDVQFKGITHPVRLHEVIRMGGDYNVAIPEKMPDAFIELAEPLPVECYLLEGKISSGNAISADIIRLGEHSAELTCSQNLKVHANLRVLLNPGVDNTIPEIYAKVLPPQTAAPEPGSHEMRLQFTWIPDAAVKYLQKIRSNQ